MNPNSEDLNNIKVDEEIKDLEGEQSEISILIEKQKVKLARIMGMKFFKIRVRSEQWNLNRILKNIKSIEKNSICEHKCTNNAIYYSHINTNKAICMKHYMLFIENSLDKKNKYFSIKSILSDVEKQCRDLDVFLLLIHACIALFESNNECIMFLNEEQFKLHIFNKTINGYISEIIQLSDITEQKNFINNLTNMLSEIKKIQNTIKNVMTLLKESLYSPLILNMFDRLKDLRISEYELNKKTSPDKAFRLLEDVNENGYKEEDLVWMKEKLKLVDDVANNMDKSNPTIYSKPKNLIKYFNSLWICSKIIQELGGTDTSNSTLNKSLYLLSAIQKVHFNIKCGLKADSISYYLTRTNYKGGDKYQNQRNLKDFMFILDLNEKADMDVLNASNQFLRMPNIKQIHISHVPDENEKLVFFLTSIAPQCIKEFSFIVNKPLLQQPLISSSFYLPSCKSILSSTTQRVKLYFLSFSGPAIETIVKSCSHASILVFGSCKLDLESKISFKGTKYNLKFISFQNSFERNEDESTNDKRFLTIVKAVADSLLKESLTKIYIKDCGLSKEVMDIELRMNGIGHIKLDDNFWF